MSCPDGVHQMKCDIKDGQIEDGSDWTNGHKASTLKSNPERCRACGAFKSLIKPCVRCENLATLFRSVGMPDEDVAQLIRVVGKTSAKQRRAMLSQQLDRMGYSQHKTAVLLAMREYEAGEAQDGYPSHTTNADLVASPTPPTVSNELEQIQSVYDNARTTFVQAIGKESLDEEGNLALGYEGLQGTPLYQKYERARTAYREAMGIDDNPDVQMGEMRNGRYVVPRQLQQDLKDVGLDRADIAELNRRFRTVGKESARQQNNKIKIAIQQRLEAEGLGHLTEEITAVMTGTRRRKQPTKQTTKSATQQRPKRVVTEATRQKLREAAKRRQRCTQCGAFMGKAACRRCENLRAILQNDGIAGQRLDSLVAQLGQITKESEAHYRGRNYELMSREARAYLSEVGKGDYALVVNDVLNHHLAEPSPDKASSRNEVLSRNEANVHNLNEAIQNSQQASTHLQVAAEASENSQNDHERSPQTNYLVEHDGDWTWIRFPDAGSLGKTEREKQYRPIFNALTNKYGARWSRKRKGWYIRRHVNDAEITRVIAASEPQTSKPAVLTTDDSIDKTEEIASSNEQQRCSRCQAFISTSVACRRCATFIDTAVKNGLTQETAEQLADMIQTDREADEDIDRRYAAHTAMQQFKGESKHTLFTWEQQVAIARAAADYVDREEAVTLRQQLRQMGLSELEINNMIAAIEQDSEAIVCGELSQRMKQIAVLANTSTTTGEAITPDGQFEANLLNISREYIYTKNPALKSVSAKSGETQPKNTPIQVLEQDALAGNLLNDTLDESKQGEMNDDVTIPNTEPTAKSQREDIQSLAEVSPPNGSNTTSRRHSGRRAGSGRRTDHTSGASTDRRHRMFGDRSVDGGEGRLHHVASRNRREGDNDRPTSVDSDPHRDGKRDRRVTLTTIDYRITDADQIGEGGLKAKYQANIEAIKTLKKIEAEGRMATPEEQAVLVKYVGWGGLSQVFDSYQASTYNRHAKWREAYHQLRELLSEDEYQAAKSSTKNAHYTSPTVIKGMWQALERMGYNEGRILEPSAGIGHFIGLMPDHIHNKTDAVAVELDDLTGRILKQLYQQADTRISGYERTNLPNHFFDMAVGNVPFGDYGVHDPTFTGDKRRLTNRIHNYFFAKALDQVKPGGIVAFVTSRYTLDSSKHRPVREYLASQADLVSAIRLPNIAFKKNANTEVTTDIIFLRKRADGEAANDVSWVDTASMPVPNSYGTTTEIQLNQYFHDNPNMMLGKMEATGRMYGDAQPQLVADERNLEQALDQAVQNLPSNIAPQRGVERCSACQAFLPENGSCHNPKCPTKRDVYRRVPPDSDVQEGAYVVEAGLLYQRHGSRLKRVEYTDAEVKTAETTYDLAYRQLPHGAIQNKQTKLQQGFEHLKESPEYTAYLDARKQWLAMQKKQRERQRVKAIIPIRDAADKVIQLDVANASDEELEAAREELNNVYDAFVEKHGYLHDYANFQAIKEDPGVDRLLSLEQNYTPEIKNTKANRDKGLTPKPASAEKMAIFFRRTIRLSEKPETAETAKDALTIALNEYGNINFPRMAELTGRTKEDLANELIDQGRIFLIPDGSYVVRDEYLSGNVRHKLREAEAAAKLDARFQGNIDVLLAIQPVSIKPKEIYMGFGAAWIPPTDMKQFMYEEIFQREVGVRHIPETGTWHLDTQHIWNTAHTNIREWGIPEAPATRLIDDALNNRLTTVYKTVGYDESGRAIREVDQEKTYEAREKQEKIKQRFREWIWQDEARTERLARIYNETYNAIVPRQYDGSHLTFPGMAEGVFGYDKNGRPHQLRPHQKNAVWRTIQNEATLLAHIVGSGKTATMIASAMEMRRMGIAQKPMITVPNHMPEQFAEDFRRMYPAANILVIDSNKMSPREKRRTMNQVATGDWDAIVITHSAFTRIPVSEESFNSFMNQEIDKLRLHLEELNAEAANYRYGQSKKQHKKTVKEIEKAIARLERQIRDRANSKKEEGVLEWEQLGVDALMVDEAHMFKNLFTATKMTRVAGVKANSGSKRAMDMFIKTQYLQRRCQCGRFISASGVCRACLNKTQTVKGKVVFATGTPVTNSMGEMYTMQRYLQREQLEAVRLGHFDNWAKQFGEMVTAIEMKPSGKGFRQKTRFAQFHNVPELMRLFVDVADIQQDPDKLGLPRPLLKGGDPLVYRAAKEKFLAFAGTAVALNGRENLAEEYTHLTDTQPYQEYLASKRAYRKAVPISVPMNDVQEAIIDRCDERAENLPPDPSVDNMLKIVNDARLASLDVRLINPNLPDDANSKINVCVRKMLDIYHETTDVAVANDEDRHNMAQMLFLDIGTPGGANFNLYQDVKEKLMAGGVPEDEIAFIHDAGDDKSKKLKIFHKVNRGEIRFLLGSTEKMGTGTNAQQRLAALHHLDAPWRPDQVEQREGRILRQGNINPEVEIYRYVTEGSFDVYMWQTLETKQGFITQVMNGEEGVRSMDDVDETKLGYAEMKAIASGNPEILEKVEVDAQLRKLESLAKAYKNTQRDLHWELSQMPKQRQDAQRMITRYRQAEVLVKRPLTNQFTMTVQDELFDSRLLAGQAIINLIEKNRNERGRVRFTPVGELYGATVTVASNDVELRKTGRDYGRATIEIGEVSLKVDLGPKDEGNITRLTNAIKGLQTKRERHEAQLRDLDEREPQIRAMLSQGFEHADKLAQLRTRRDELETLIRQVESQQKQQVVDDDFGDQEDDGDGEYVASFDDKAVNDMLTMVGAAQAA